MAKMALEIEVAADPSCCPSGTWCCRPEDGLSGELSFSVGGR